ncbi:5-bromo-4-chloroindolyl phosphate hydrolysis protein [Pilibacter termitis]|jgi:5-bromo-4-chloroindolyl phosphate hydrolysis protein|uniref:5-bromo-4-chloroindolyl phosphate hydrolysis protein n=1 Tax=Pilibacter termitis TaxID=263852 RepID=A0A1T4Q6P0_9ENTE|nr:5-bromo-4-chloroindolyl phosphate hydrolysis family protein [Pilibacter termitis]SJZ99415.1 5-bromo-4-chloroindolyl phosphate hydrolysis protein [Pilibacter termitis]
MNRVAMFLLKYFFPLVVFFGLIDKMPNDIFALAWFGLLLAYYAFVPKSKKHKEKKKLKKKGIPLLSSDKWEHYKQVGLSDNEIELFRETMANLQRDIKDWETAIHANSKLRAIDLRTDGLKAAKALFKELVQEPNRMNEASDFIYKHIPSIRELTAKYQEVASHEVKSSEVFATLQNSADIITKLSEEIARDYTKFVKNDLEDLEIELTVAKKSISVDNEEIGIPDFSKEVPDYSQYLKEKDEIKV